MNQQIMSIYIPRVSVSTTENEVIGMFYKYKIGEVSRVDFTPINKKEGFGEDVDSIVKSAFVHFSHYYNESTNQKLLKTLRSGKSYRLYLDDFNSNIENVKYWLLLKAKTVVQETMMNNHQIVENCRFLEKRVEEQENTIQKLTDDLESVRMVVNQLIGGLFCHQTQDNILDLHSNILFNKKTDHPDDQSKWGTESKWGANPTTRQGDENESRIEVLEKLQQYYSKNEYQDDSLQMRKLLNSCQKSFINDLYSDDDIDSCHSSLP